MEQCWRDIRALRTCFWASPHFSFLEWAVGSQGWSCQGPGCMQFVGRKGFGQDTPAIRVLHWCGSASFSAVFPGEKSLSCLKFSLPVLSFVACFYINQRSVFFQILFNPWGFFVNSCSVSYCIQNMASNWESISLTCISLLIWELVCSWPMQVPCLRRKASVLWSTDGKGGQPGYNQLSLAPL